MTAVAGRRTYTEEELQAALRDIQSGKLGTRRAAVIYGIPRSTLRNKVYKLAMERERESHLVPPVPLEDEVMEDDKELSGAEEEKEVEKALQAPLLSMADILRFSSNIDAPEALKNLLLQKAGKEGDLWAGLEHSAVGPYIQNLLLASQQKAAQENTDFMPMLPEIMRKMISEEQHLNNGDSEKSHMQASPSNSVKGVKVEPQDMDTEESSSNVILKIPSFKPTTSKNGGDSVFGSAVVSPPVTSESSGSPPILPGNMLSLREAIAKSISQKMHQSPEPHKMHPNVEMDFKRAGLTPPLTSMPVIKNHQDPPSTPQPNRSFPPVANKQPQNTNNNSAAATGGKGTRPKRGKYRNYDRDSLVEAVRAVQRGEMSVHRAGSYYGVPHSTLEYKVKERHLMRPRKRDPKPNPVDEKIASMKNQEIRNNLPEKMKPVIKPPQKFPPTSPNGIKIPPMFDPSMAPLGYTPPPFPFWPHPSFPHLPLDYPRNASTSQYSPNPEYYASQMMQRLQEDSGRVHPNATGTASSTNNQPALAKSAREMAESLYDGTGANGSFLDGIIRSSLESGVPHSGDKNKEDTKNVTPENMSNKALLDQLCRNSRITPLPKANASTEPNSSGDESYRKGTSPINFATNRSSKDRDSPIALNLGKVDGTSPVRFKDNNHDIQTIELSNDSNDSQNEGSGRKDDSDQSQSQKSMSGSPPARIYVKPQFQEITKPENLKPEVLVRYRESLMDEPQQQMVERNGITPESAIGSASEDMAQD